jgi:hypothetical protein
MKHLKLAMICLCFTFAVMAVTGADAGKIKQPKKGQRTEKTEEQMKPQRFNNQPSMDFLGGTLTQDPHAGWKIGNTSLYIGKGCVIKMDGVEEGGYLAEGREAIVMGARFGNAISARSIHISQPRYKSMGLSQSPETKETGPNPNVGKIVRPVE